MSFTLHETTTRVAIKDGKRTIAYVAIGAEIHAPVLAAAPELLEALIELRRHCPPAGVRISMALQNRCDAAIAKARQP